MAEYAFASLKVSRDTTARTEAAKLLGAIAEQLRRAIAVWEEVDRNYAQGDMSVNKMVGPGRATRLYEIRLASEKLLKALAAVAGGRAVLMASMPEQLVEDAYRQLREGQTLEDRREQAIEHMQARIGRLEEMRAALGG
jgi:hypothetical protein